MELIVDTRDFRRLIVELTSLRNAAPAATASAMNRTLAYTKTQISREVRQVYAIKDQDIKETLNDKKASKSDLTAYIKSSGRTLTLYNHFRVTPKTITPGRKYKVKVAIKKGSSKQINTNQSPFIARANNSTQVFKREGSKRTPVIVLRSLSIPQMISNEGIAENVKTKACEMLEKRIDHEIQWRLQRAAQRMGGS